MTMIKSKDKSRYRAFFIGLYLLLITVGSVSIIALNSVYNTNAKIENSKYQFEKSQIVMLKIQSFILHATQLAQTLRVMLETFDEKKYGSEDYSGHEIMKAEIERYLHQIVESSPDDLIYGSGAWYEPYAFDKSNQYFGPYVHRSEEKNKLRLTYEWTTKEYDFHNQHWYLLGIKSGAEPAFTDPYFDNGMFYMTLSLAFNDRKSGRRKGVLSVDMILPQLQKLVENASLGGADIIYVVNRSDKIIAHAKADELLKLARSRHPNSDEIKSVLDIDSPLGLLDLKHPVVYKDKIGFNDWSIVVASEEDLLFARYFEIRTIFFFILAVYIIFTTVALLVAYSFMVKFSRLRKLAFDTMRYEKNQIKTILDNVQYGLLCANQDGIIQAGYSRYCTKILSDDPQANLENASIYDVLGLNGKYRNRIESFYQQVFNVPMLAAEFAHLIPSGFKVNNKMLKLDFYPILNGDKIENILLSFTDVTNMKETEKENSENRSLIKIIENIERFQILVHEIFAFNETELDLGKSDQGESKLSMRRKIHTWKGDFSVYELVDIVAHLQMLEDLFDEKWELLEALFLFKQFKATLSGYLTKHQSVIKISVGTDRPVLEEDKDNIIKFKSLQDSDYITAYYAAAAREVASRLHKKVRVEYMGTRVVFPVEYREVIESLIHVVRNAVDHGLEEEGDRNGKNAEGKIEISFKETEDSYYLAIADDGKGIDLVALESKVIKNGFETEASWERLSKNEKLAYVFVDRISTKDYVSDVSGRGIGLNVLYSNVKKLGGEITITTKGGIGTKFECIIPKVRVPALCKVLS